MTQSNAKRETFSGRKAFIMAAIGSAVGLGNIWRFPYTTYENGGGAFIIPYLIALLTAGIPLLFLDYAIGHRHRGGAPLSYRRFNPHFEVFGWWQVMVNVIIGLYYAVVLGWAASYTYFSLNSAWGDQPIDFFLHEFLKMGDISNGVSFEFVGMVTGPLIAVWLVALGVLSLGIQKGISKSSDILMPVLVVMFVALVVYSLFLPGAEKGLNALFTPDWSKLSNPSVWIAAYGQIFFSLSICFGIMITYASYLKKDSDLTGSGLVVGLPMMVVSVILFGTTTGLPMLDVFDKFVNYFGIVAVAFVSLIVIVANEKLGLLGNHLNQSSSFKVGFLWRLCIVITTGILAFMLFSEGAKVFTEGYEGYPSWFVNIFGWGMAISLVVVSFILSRLKWKNEDNFKLEEKGE